MVRPTWPASVLFSKHKRRLPSKLSNQRTVTLPAGTGSVFLRKTNLRSRDSPTRQTQQLGQRVGNFVRPRGPRPFWGFPKKQRLGGRRQVV